MTDDQWAVFDPDRDNTRHVDSRREAETVADELDAMGVDVEILPPGEQPADAQSAAAQVVGSDAAPDGGDPARPGDPGDSSGRAARRPDTHPDARADELPARSIAEDPLRWVPGEFVDEIDGSPAINRKGFEVLSHFYDVDVHVDLDVAPEETDFRFCRVKATAVTAEGRECEEFGSAHVDRGDDAEILLEMADTRARKRALSVATGVGAVAVEELRNEVDR